MLSAGLIKINLLKNENMNTEKTNLENEKPTLSKGDVMPSVTRNGFTQVMNGEELWVNTTTDEIVKFVVKDSKTRWELYCKHVKITIEVIDENALD